MATRIRRNDRPLGDWRAHYEQIWKPMNTPTTEPRDRMTLASFLVAREATRKAAAAFERVKPDCRACVHFDMGRCKQFDQDIPKEFQQTPEACEGWEFDGIPF
jgi:hypothetical protein